MLQHLLNIGKGTIMSIALLCNTHNLLAQVTGGRSSFTYLNVSNSPHVSAMGGIVPASYDKDVSFMLQNPALLNKQYHNQLSLGYNAYYANIGILNVAYANYSKRHDITYGLSVQQVGYGKMLRTDAFGNTLGELSANDLSVNFSASKTYLEKWRYGATIKLANSNLGDRSAFAILADVGIVYDDPDNLLTIGAVAKNIGGVLKKYNPENPSEPLPFDLQLGIMKGLKNVPLKLFLAVHHLYEWDIRYNDPANITQDLLGNPTEDVNAKKFGDKLFRHINLGAELTLAKAVTATVGYNHIRRSELGHKNLKGLSGFSFGANINLKKMYIQYGIGNFGNGIPYHEFGLILQLNKLINAKGKLAKGGWNDIYE